jgi:hypothetical protein
MSVYEVIESAAVLNGEVHAGDSVAYATHAGSLTQMHIGTVVGIELYDHPWANRKARRLKVRVTRESGYHDNHSSLDVAERLRTIERLNRVVKLT